MDSEEDIASEKDVATCVFIFIIIPVIILYIGIGFFPKIITFVTKDDIVNEKCANCSELEKLKETIIDLQAKLQSEKSEVKRLELICDGMEREIEENEFNE